MKLEVIYVVILDKVSGKIALTFKRINPEETASVEVMKFSIALILNLVSIVILSGVVGFFLGTLGATMFSLFAFALLRFFSGGVHLPVSEYCIAVSTAIFVIIPHFPVNERWCIIFTFISVVLVLLYAPSRIEQQTRIPEKYYPALKVISACIVAANFWLRSDILALTFFVQAVLLIRMPTLLKKRSTSNDI